MTDAPSDLVSRGRAIFERLRGADAEAGAAEVEGSEGGAEADGDEPAAAEQVAEPAGAPGDVATVPGADEPDDTAPAEARASAETPPIEAPSGGTPEDGPGLGSEVAQEAPVLEEPGQEAEDGEQTAREAPAPDPDPAPEAEAEVESAIGEPGGAVVVDERPVAAGSEAGEAAEPAATAPRERPPRELPRVIAVANQKGGVGKTTTAVNLGAAMADLGYRVLVVDLDPQGNATTGLGLNTRDLQVSMYDVILHDTPLEDCVEATSVRNLFVAPASLDLAGAEIELVPAFSRELRLKRALDDVHDDYDFVFIDCPPSLGLLTVNSLAAATEVLVPIQCEYYALEGLGQLLRNVNLVQKNLNTALEVSTIVLVMYDARTKLSDQVVQEVKAHFGEKVCRTVVPRTVRLSEAPSFGQPITAFDPTSRGAIAYRELAKEVSGGAPQRAR